MERVVKMMIKDLPRGSGLKTPLHTKKRRLLPETTVSNVNLSFWCSTHLGDDAGPSSQQIPPQRDDEKSDDVFYGSDESEEENNEEEGNVPVLVPRPVRMFLENEEDNDDKVGIASSELTFAWPPRFSTPGSAAPAATPPVAQRAGPAPAPSSPPVEQRAGPAQGPAPAPNSPPVEQRAGSAPAPMDKFKFEWRAFTQPQINPDLRREPFSQINCGPTASYASPYDAFIDIWDRQIMEHIVTETNLYAQQVASRMMHLGTMRPNSRITKWFDTNVDELYVFFAIILSTGIVVKTRLDEYWNTAKNIFSTPEFAAVMSYDRFVLLMKCMHFRDNGNCNSAAMSRTEAKLFKVQPILDHLNHKFSTLYVMDRNVALDESLTMWKGWLEINQFIKNKAAAVGIKTYEVYESRTGYLWRFEVHAGHEESSNPQVDGPVSGVIPALVLRLLNGLEHRGHTVWMDSFYNSPALARELKYRGFDCVGTLRTNRQFVPVELANLKKKDMAVGQVCGCTSGDVDLVLWRDKNRVAFISTYHGLATTNCDDKVKPTVVADYNICMGGVDRKDQMLAMFPIERKQTTVWYKKLFRRLLNVSILNAYILLKSQQSITHRSFRKILVKQLLSRHTTPQPSHRMIHTQSDSNTQGFQHYPQQYLATEAKNSCRHRRNCVECGKRVTSFCKGCDKALCLFTCFEPYHTKLLRNTKQ